MSQSVSQLYVHLVFSTKGRRRILRDGDRVDLHNYVGGILLSLRCHPIEINSVLDHIHILADLPRTATVANIIREIKVGSRVWLIKRNGMISDFYWQSGYGAFSVGRSELGKVRRYIQNQRQHHRVRSFEDEFRDMCNAYGVRLDERFAWD